MTLEFMKKIPNLVVLYEFLKHRCQRYVPCKRDFTLAFAKEVLAGRKKLLKLKEVNWIDKVPNWEETTTKIIWNEMRSKFPQVVEYFPKYPKTRLPEKSYLLNVMNTVVPDSIHKAVCDLKLKK